MQNYEQILSELGIEVPEDKKAALKDKMSENYRTKSDYEKAVDARDKYKKSLDEVQEKLDDFKDVDVNDLKNQITTLTQQLTDEKTSRAKDAARAELEKTVNTFLASVDDKGAKKFEFLNDITADHYRAALMEELEKDSAKGKSISDIFSGMITGEDGKQKDGIFVNRSEQHRARFTTGMNRGNGDPGEKKLSDMSLDERIKLKASDPEYYESLKSGN
jgi:hypothetical protein